jgi:hypothetical protein
MVAMRSSLQKPSDAFGRMHEADHAIRGGN